MSTRQRLIELVDSWPGARIAVIGDAMDDRYVFGDVKRICPEGPVPVLNQTEIQVRAGGAANVYNQLIALGAIARGMFPFERSLKTRYMQGAHLLLRVDRDVFTAPTQADIDAAVAAVVGAHAVILSDYAKGWLTWDMCQAVISEARHQKIPVIVDPKAQDWSKFHGATVYCPNQVEFHGASGGDPEAHVIVKRGADGLRHYPPVEETTMARQYDDYPAQARHVYDVTGAGDTVTAVVAATLARCNSYEEACILANLAAGYVVGEVGTAVISAQKLKELINDRFED